MDKLLQEAAAEYNVASDLLRCLIEIEKSKVHLQKRRGIKAEIRRAIEQYMEKHKP